ncbi:hypothetical protein E2C01_088309 [Portunus trituberculatus]|uniref:Uncharacterized protein n=1 Tax=Portunus trituberculatus TaxID=210409 RepID=A0A5B7JJ14_PORTR|nr:hypothetical protein [Portunus trituberculatus]
MSAEQSYQRVMPVRVWAALILMATVFIASVVRAKQDDENGRELLIQQKTDLEKLKCEPVLSIVQLEGELEFHDPLADEDFFPRVFAINRCSEASSFCGNTAMGMPTGKCQPVKIERRIALASYIKGSKMVSQEVLVNEHISCACCEDEVHDQKVRNLTRKDN